MKKIVITGLGMVTPVGNGKDVTWSSLKAGKCGIGRITKFDPSRCTCQVAGELKDFDAYLAEKGYVDRKAARHMDPFSIYGVAAAVEAWKDAGFSDENKPDMDRVATIIGNGIGGMKIFRDLIWQMQGLMREDHRFFKSHGQYDFPQKQWPTMLKMYLVGMLISNEKIKAKMGNKMNEGMIAPYKKVLDKISK